MSSQRIAELKTLRGYFAAFGQTEKVKAVDMELAELRGGPEKATRTAAKPAPTIETATADTSGVESADDSVREVRSATRKRAAKPKG